MTKTWLNKFYDKMDNVQMMTSTFTIFQVDESMHHPSCVHIINISAAAEDGKSLLSQVVFRCAVFNQCGCSNLSYSLVYPTEQVVISQ